MATTMEQKTTERANLLGMIKPGDTVYTVIRSVAKSGMSRTMSVFVIREGRLVNVTFSVAKVLGYTLVDVDGHRAIRVNGVGMDMGYHVVYSLGHALYRRTEGEDPGYSLNHAWI